MIDIKHAAAAGQWKRMDRLVTVLESKNLPIDPQSKQYLVVAKRFEATINHLGQCSAKAQDLLEPITSWRRFSESQGEEQRLYLLHSDDSDNSTYMMGLLKVGRRQIYTLDLLSGQQKPTKALCVLDFYISERFQREGWGVRLFDYMLDRENVRPCHLAYDRPSFRLINFLSKHYHLDKPQHFYRFVVFPAFNNHISNNNQLNEGNHRNIRSAKSPQPIINNNGRPGAAKWLSSRMKEILKQ